MTTNYHDDFLIMAEYVHHHSVSTLTTWRTTALNGNILKDGWIGRTKISVGDRPCRFIEDSAHEILPRAFVTFSAGFAFLLSLIRRSHTAQHKVFLSYN
jgi:hypothetical protein